MDYALVLKTDDGPVERRKHVVEKSINKRKIFKCCVFWLKIDMN
jgi:hypothetical protein